MSDAPFDDTSENTYDFRQKEGSDPTDDGRPPETDHRWSEENLTETGPVDIGRSRLERRLGCGGMAVVYAGQHLHTKASIAIKVIPRRHALATHLRREIELLAEANHPYLVKIIDHGEHSGYCWLAMELLEGMTLAELIESSRNEASEKDISSTTGSDPMVRVAPSDTVKRKLPELREIVEMFRRLALALASLHERNILHRDVKPSNIVVSPDGVPRICDFGLATPDDDQEHQRGILQGTIRYMAPEQVTAGHVKLDASADLYSLAITFHEALTLVRPNVSDSRESSLLKAVHEAPLPPSRASRGVPRTLDPIFRKALARQPHERYRSGADLAKDLECWLSGKRPVHARETLHERAARLRLPIAVSIVVVALIAFAFVRSIEPDTRFDRIRQAMEAEDWDLALQIVDSEVMADESDAEFASLEERLIRKSSEGAVWRTLSQQNLALATPTTRKRRLDHARLHLRIGKRWQEPSLVFRGAFMLMLADFEAATVILDKPEFSTIGCRSAATARLRRMLANVCGTKLGEPWASADPRPHLDEESDLCLRAMESVWRRPRGGCFGTREQLGAIEAEISKCLNDVEGSAGVGRNDHNRLLLALRAQVRSAMRQSRKALEDLDTLLALYPVDEQNAAAHFFRAVEEARLIISGQETNDDDMRRAGDSLRRLLNFEAIPWVGRIAAQIDFNASREGSATRRDDWLEAMIGIQSSKLATIDPQLASALAFEVEHQVTEGADDRAIALARLYQPVARLVFDAADDASPGERELMDTARSDFAKMQNAFAWTLYKRGAHSANVEESRAAFDEAIAVIELERQRQSEFSLEFEAVGVLTGARRMLLDRTSRADVSEETFREWREALQELRRRVENDLYLPESVDEVLAEFR